MRYTKFKSIIFVLSLLVAALFLLSCNSDDDVLYPRVDPAEEASLLFMLEEEKMARDVYSHLYDLYGTNQFKNIKGSEQRHMNYVSDLLDARNVNYEILGAGKFKNSDLQNLYDQLIVSGEKSIVDAFRVGATIEDVDIYDLTRLMAETNDAEIIGVFTKLTCGSENHMRAFTRSLENQGESYTPLYITETEYENILTGSNQHCG